MGTLVDTGILLRAFDANFSQYRAIRQALRRALSQKAKLVVTVQNIAEFWNVSTRPLDKNGQGLSHAKVRRRIEMIERLCRPLSEDIVSYTEWKRLVEQYAVTGVQVHDARLVSVMLRVGVHEILTLNESDFERYRNENIAVTSPECFLNGST